METACGVHAEAVGKPSRAFFETVIASLDLDGGRSLGLEHPGLLLGAGEWAGHVLEALENGVRVPGKGGAQELRLRRSAAGVVLKVDELSSRWRQSMITI